MIINICLDCLQEQKPWVSEDKIILYSEPDKCDKCCNQKQLVFRFIDKQHDKLFNIISSDIKVIGYPWNDVCEKLNFSLQNLVRDLGWDIVRDKYMYIKGQEDGKPLAFSTPEEYEPYLNYRVVELGNKIIIEPRSIDV